MMHQLARRTLAVALRPAAARAHSTVLAGAVRPLAAMRIATAATTPFVKTRASARSLFIQTESTPSEDSLKFKPGVPVLGAEARTTLEFTTSREAQEAGSPLAAALLRIEGVTSVLFGSDFVAVTKDADTAWQLVKPDVFGTMTDHFASAAAGGAPVVDAALAMQAPADTVIHPDDSEVVAMIKELLDTRIRPTIQDDGGDIEYCGFDEASGVVKLKLKGACRTCDSSVVTLKNGIENMLQYFIPEVKAVEQVLDEAERIANEEFAKLEQVIAANNSNEGVVMLKD
ncbi:hypothetical protein H9P43_005736 [Blastocladiella emersonii ATCC 22665]|nr:hypothetical protein H9P43_005736 [Blastocladiella emersonii ATCC 22665]